MSSSHRIKREITKKFKRLGLSLKKCALNKVLELYVQCDSNDIEFNAVLEELGELTLSQKLLTPIISLKQIEPVIQQILNTANNHQDANEENLLFLESAFEARRFKYKRIGKQFVEISSSNECLHGSANDLSSFFIERYEMLLQRTLNHSLFRKSSLNKKGTRSTHLSSTQEIIGTTTKKCIFGILCSRSGMNEGRVYLQDLDGTIQIDFNTERFKKESLVIGLFTFNCFVLCFGFMNNDRNIFEIESIDFPPYERRKQTFKNFNNLNFVSLEQQQIMFDLEQKAEGDSFIFMNNVYLDEPQTFAKLCALFDGYATLDVAPTLFVFMGNFTSNKFGKKANDFKILSSLFDKFADLLVNKYGDTLCKSSDFIFIPGSNDQLCANLLPQPPLIPNLRKKFDFYKENGKIAVHFQSNPFRIRFGTQQIVCFKQNLLQKMRRNCVISPKMESQKEAELTNHLCKTILDQSNLNPLPIQISPIYWNYAHSLNLYPTPHLIVLGDANQDYKWQYLDSTVCCPGNFTETGRFIAYYPSNKFLDFSQVQL